VIVGVPLEAAHESEALLAVTLDTLAEAGVLAAVQPAEVVKDCCGPYPVPCELVA
jgi:hypothetical protein